MTAGAFVWVSAALVAVTAHLVWVVPRLSARVAWLLAAALVVAGSAACFWVANTFLVPLTALVFGHVGWWLRGARQPASERFSRRA